MLFHNRTEVGRQLADKLAAYLGHTNLRDYAGGKQDWTDAGLPIESERQEAMTSP